MLNITLIVPSTCNQLPEDDGSCDPKHLEAFKSENADFLNKRPKQRIRDGSVGKCKYTSMFHSLHSNLGLLHRVPSHKIDGNVRRQSDICKFHYLSKSYNPTASRVNRDPKINSSMLRLIAVYNRCCILPWLALTPWENSCIVFEDQNVTWSRFEFSLTFQQKMQ